jgi:hypothetical protein
MPGVSTSVLGHRKMTMGQTDPVFAMAAEVLHWAMQTQRRRNRHPPMNLLMFGRV